MPDLTHCDCGYGQGFFHTRAYGHHEYHPDLEPTEAGLKLAQDQTPLAIFYAHISCEYAFLLVNTTGEEFRFRYKHYRTQGRAFDATVRHIKGIFKQADFFGFAG